MAELSEIRELTTKILELERRTGHQDAAVIGGLEGFVDRVASELRGQVASELLSKLESHVHHYGRKSVSERRRVVRALADLLEDLSPTGSQVGSAPSEEAEDAGPPQEGDLTHPIRFAKGVGGRRARLLSRLGIETVEDLLLHIPRRIEDRRRVKRIGQLRNGEEATVTGRVRAVDVIRPRPRLEIVKAAIQDNTGLLYAVWFNQPWLERQLSRGERIALYGKAERQYGELKMNNPVWEPADERFLTGCLVPVYRATEGLPPALLSRLIRDNLERCRARIRELVPRHIRERQELLPRAEALRAIHFPESLESYERARRSLAFEELLLFQIGVALARCRTERVSAPPLGVSDETLGEFLSALPFKLTGAQARALREIREDLASGHPMNRLLQGEVGSGKTAVAAAAAYVVARAGAQTALMAPTEILARQHHEKLEPLLASLGVRTELLIGSQSQAHKERIRAEVASGEVDVVVGTHALLGERVRFRHLGLAVVDEQHRFGVIQRAELEGKGETPHVLVMSATPIPRTITLTLYGQFDISLIDELPRPREVRTYWVSEDRREEVYQLVARRLAEGGQAYVVYPLIEDSYELELRSATRMKEELERTFFQRCKVGLLHGRMDQAEVGAVMERVRRGELDVLVSTTIIEVGIDVPDASIMVIEHAERFGLSQLHQLRGRIGRQGQKALCFAIATAKTEEARRRLAAFRDLDDGFQIAEEDLQIRGPGELLGLSQHGLDSTFKVADLIRDLPLMKAARDEAFRLLEEAPDSPLMEEFERRFGGRFELARV